MQKTFIGFLEYYLKKRVPFNADKMMKLLVEKNIGTRPFFFPMHLQPVFNKMGLFLNE